MEAKGACKKGALKKRPCIGGSVPVVPVDDKVVEVSTKGAVEYPLPGAAQTHELVVMDGMIVVSQQSSSTLLKIKIDDDGRPQECRTFVIGGRKAGLHGVHASTNHVGKIWLTLQFTSQLLLVDPVLKDVDAAPIIELVLNIPPPGRGPHVVVEYGDSVWASCKDSHHVVRMGMDGSSSLYEVSRTPVFVAPHPSEPGVVYASIDQMSKVARINSISGNVLELDIPKEKGRTPVGLISGRQYIWFVLAGSPDGGTGTLGRVGQDEQVHYIRLPNKLGINASLLHLALSTAFESDQTMYLLSSSIIDGDAENCLFQVKLNEGLSRIEEVRTLTLPTQRCKAHRVFPSPKGLFVTELASSVIARCTFAMDDPPIDETGDYYGLFGWGAASGSLYYE